MAQIFITAGIFFLIIVSLFLILVVLMQRANSDGGLGTAFGSTITESAFGTEAGNVMTKITRITFVVFFAVAFVLYLAVLAQQNHHAAPQKSLFEEEAAAEAKAEQSAPAAQNPAPATSEKTPTAPAR
jgi:preprotein translocase subunit SecG